ncbi:uncharacterized protein VP01_2286g1 [Puccinia sorghi]|uniref:Uncharacterized protein n=1 Tax=Puccinia sorghi TaxID=27349 RepID=A0A0L6V885_9BASI|nr:uncharacterized protein VP01_2286g1 [Puccinia sorghi]
MALDMTYPLPSFCFSPIHHHHTELTSESLQKALFHFIANANLPFSVVERKSLRYLLYLINEKSGPLMDQISWKCISNHLSKFYLHYKEKVKREFLVNQGFILFKSGCLDSTQWCLWGSLPNLLIENLK